MPKVVSPVSLHSRTEGEWVVCFMLMDGRERRIATMRRVVFDQDAKKFDVWSDLLADFVKRLHEDFGFDGIQIVEDVDPPSPN